MRFKGQRERGPQSTCTLSIILWNWRIRSCFITSAAFALQLSWVFPAFQTKFIFTHTLALIAADCATAIFCANPCRFGSTSLYTLSNIVSGVTESFSTNQRLKEVGDRKQESFYLGWLLISSHLLSIELSMLWHWGRLLQFQFTIERILKVCNLYQ